MTVHVHALHGCTPEPLAHYLKALGILRLVSEQRDISARGFWKNEIFTLTTSLDREGLEAFFCNAYSPTPVLAPWNGGSGFYPKHDREAIHTIRLSTSPRFEPYRRAIRCAEQLVGARTQQAEDDEKDALLAACARSQDDLAYAWISAVVALDREGKGQFPALLGSGGNDGNLEFTYNFIQRLVDLIDVDAGVARPEAKALLDLALFGGARRGLVGQAIGQFFPGAAGGANGTAGFKADARMNPWDFVLMLEGAVVLRVASLRKLDGADLAQAAAPFAVRSTTEGYASAATSDASARGEQWMPLWTKPATLGEVEHLFAEAKLASGRTPATSALDAARAIARLGAARGISSFHRFSFLQRNGRSNFAVPLGVIPVAASSSVRLLDEIDVWLESLRRAARGDRASAALVRDLRSIEGAAFACTDSRAGAEAWSRLVMALGEAEHGMVCRPRATHDARLRPLPKLSANWLKVIQDGRAETRIAIAIASTGARGLGPIRVHCAPLSLSLDRFEATGESLAHDPRVVWRGRDLVEDLAQCVLRRVIEAREAGFRGFALGGRMQASPHDVAAFLTGSLDDSRIAKLARGLMAVDFDNADPIPAPRTRVPGALATYAIFRTAYSAHAWGDSAPPNDPTAVRQLIANRVDDALRTATSRLVAMGLRPKLRIVVGGASSRRIAAALSIPLSRQDYEAVRDLVARPFYDAKETPS